MSPTEPIPTGPAFSARLHDALATLGAPVTTPEQRHGGWLLGLERTATEVRTGIPGSQAWAIALDVVRAAVADPATDAEDRASLRDVEEALAAAVEEIKADGTPMVEMDDIYLTQVALTFALADAHDQGGPVAGRSALEILMALGHVAITLICSEQVLPGVSA